MEKISMSQVVEVLSHVAPTLQQLVSERDEALAKIASYERRMEAEKVASAMIQKGLSNEPFEHLVENLVKVAEQGKLEVWTKAVEISGPDMGEKVAHVANDTPISDASLASEHDLIRFIVGDVG